MAKINFTDFKNVEPQQSNRFLINIIDSKIPSHLFRKYKIYNEDETLIFKTEFIETVRFTFNPADFFQMTEVEIDYFDPVGEIINTMSFEVKGSNFKKVGSYSKGELSTVKLRFIINNEKIKFKHKNIID